MAFGGTKSWVTSPVIMGIPTTDEEGADAVVPLAGNVATTLRLPKDLLQELAEARRWETDVRKLAKVEGAFKLNEQAKLFLRWALRQYWVDNGLSAVPPPKGGAERAKALRAAMDKRLKDSEQQAPSGERGSDEE